MHRSPRRARPRAVSLLLLAAALAASTLGTSLPARAEADPLVSVIGGARQARGGNEIGLWLNSPTAAVTIQNPTGRFYRASVRWHNVPVHSFLVSPQGVVDVPSRSGPSLLARVLISAGGAVSWRLDPNLKGDYAFAVTGGSLKGLEGARSASLDFAIHLGNAGGPLATTLPRLEAMGFPTYLLPGSNDSRREFEERTGEIRRDFAIGPDRFLLIDNADGHVGVDQRTWAASRLASYRQQKVRYVFVFTHWPLFDPRQGRHAQMARRDAKQLHAIFKAQGVNTVFSSQVPGLNQTVRQGVTYHTVGSGAAILVRVQGDRLLLKALP